MIDLPDSVSSIGTDCFNLCRNLKDAVIRPIVPPTIGNGIFNNTHADLKIYVPDDSVETYKTATSWNSYATRIHPLSEYVES